MAEAVVGRALLAVGEGLVGLVDFLELDLGFVVARVAVRVVLHRELAEGGFHLRFGGGSRDAENLIIIALGHVRRPWERSAAPSFCRTVSPALHRERLWKPLPEHRGKRSVDRSLVF
jgi:hypothetical protein